MNKGLRDGKFETPDLSRERAYRHGYWPRLFDKRHLPAVNIWKTLTEKKGLDFVRSNPIVEEDRHEDIEWCVHQFLGGGSFGGVAAWLKRDEAGNVIDEIAIKEINGLKNKDAHMAWNERPDGPLLTEAVVQAQLNKGHHESGLQNENIVHLRGYKYFVSDSNATSHEQSSSSTSTKRKYRLYQELAPYGNLAALWYRYRYWNTYLPEAFLWHLFDSLTSAAIQMLEPSKDGLPAGKAGRQVRETDQVVHFDFKPGNIFLGRPDHRDGIRSTWGGTRKYDYPVVKIGDFGFSKYTGDDDVNNPLRWMLRYGTACYMSPEQLCYGACWGTSCPNGDFSRVLPTREKETLVPQAGGRTEDELVELSTALLDDRFNLDFKLLENANVWGIGKVLYDCMTLANTDSEYWEISTLQRREFERWSHQVQDFHKTPWAERSFTYSSPYSKTLTDLVSKCTLPAIKNRISLKELKKETESGRRHFDAAWEPGCEAMPKPKRQRTTLQPKLCYKNNEINAMPRGAENFKIDSLHYRFMHKECAADPDWPDLSPRFDYKVGGVILRHHEDPNEDWYDISKDFVLHEGQIRRKESLNNATVDTQGQGGDDQPTDNPSNEHAGPSNSSSQQDPNNDAEAQPETLDDQEPEAEQPVEPAPVVCMHDSAASDIVTTDPSDNEFELVRAKRVYPSGKTIYYNPKSRYKINVTNRDDDKAKRKAKRTYKYKDYFVKAKEINSQRRQQENTIKQLEHAQAQRAWAAQNEARKQQLVEKTYQDALKYAHAKIASQDGYHEDRSWDSNLGFQILDYVVDNVDDQEILAVVEQRVAEEFPEGARWPVQTAVTPTSPHRNRAKHQAAPYTAALREHTRKYERFVDEAGRNKLPELPPYVNPRDDTLEFVQPPGHRQGQGYYTRMIDSEPHRWDGSEWVRIVTSDRYGAGASSQPLRPRSPQSSDSSGGYDDDGDGGQAGGHAGGAHEDPGPGTGNTSNDDGNDAGQAVARHVAKFSQWADLEDAKEEGDELRNAAEYLQKNVPADLSTSSEKSDLQQALSDLISEVLRDIDPKNDIKAWQKALAYRIIMSVLQLKPSSDEDFISDDLNLGQANLTGRALNDQEKQVLQHLTFLPAFYLFTWLGHSGRPLLGGVVRDLTTSILRDLSYGTTNRDLIDYICAQARAAVGDLDTGAATQFDSDQQQETIAAYAEIIDAFVFPQQREHSDDSDIADQNETGDGRPPSAKETESSSHEQEGEENGNPIDDAQQQLETHLSSLRAWNVVKIRHRDTIQMVYAKSLLQTSARDTLDLHVTNTELLTHPLDSAREHLEQMANLAEVTNDTRADRSAERDAYGELIEDLIDQEA